ncbi:Vegetative incompatibility protein HET-E-1 [Fusarium oxysporum]|nr:Vegetative incompatibility protein HET-E-1 [Fusarium oxysporum]
MLEAKPSMKRPNSDYTYQGAENDRLFEPQYDHVGGSNCDKCDLAWQVQRKQRESSDPEIHYGIIASGNKLIKDAATRDNLFGHTGHQCLCVEMEAAGLMDRFPCLVIRGICDYADSHKNDRWQRYAAATAAAFAVELLEYVPVAQLEATQKIAGVIQSLYRRISGLSTPIHNLDHRTALNQLLIAEGASFDSKAEEHNPICLPDTRQELLKEIERWIDSSESKTIFWLNGMAGTGKSTISRTVAHSRLKRGDLGASFFFKRGEVDRGNLNKLMSTLAYQLASSIPGVAFFIKKTLDDNPAVVGKSVREQFQKLIQEPLSEAAASTIAIPPVVMVIDALDECDQEADIRLLINILSQAKTVLPQLRVFLTSRPELPIRLGFSEVQGSYQDLVLHEIPMEIVEHDILVFLNDEFKKIRHSFNMTVGGERKLPPDWPGRPIVQSLAQMAVPLFIFAATVCRFVDDRKRDSPPIQLRKVLDYKSKDPVSQLDRTYGPVLHSLITDIVENDKKQIVKDFKLIVGSIVMLADPLSVWALSQLLEVDPDVVDNRLDTLHSVLSIPPIRKAHNREDSSLSTFLADAVRFLQANFSVVAEAPLQIYCCLAFAPSKTVLRKTLGNAIPKWIKNLPKVQENWDACLLTLEGHSGDVDSVVFSHNLKKVASGSYDWTIRIWDAETGKCERVLDGHSNRVSSVVFSHDSKKVASGSYDMTVRIWDVETGKCEKVLEGHSSAVYSVAFSHNLKKVASGSFDQTIRIWDTEAGECKRVLEGHSSSVKSVVFSHDLKRVVSGSDDKTIRIWDAETGECERVLEGHSYRVSSVVFSHDSNKVASGSSDKTIRIWDTETGECTRVLQGHSDEVDSVVFSPESTTVASTSRDMTVRIWDVKTGKCEHRLEGHGGLSNSVVVSPQSTMVASALRDKTVRIWDAKTGACERTLESHSDEVNSVVVSPQSTMVASASHDKTIRIWDAETGKCKRVLDGHSDSVTSVAFSHDSKKVASASQDKTIRIWDTKTGACERVLEGHSDSVSSVVFSHDSKRIVSGSYDKTIQIWDTEKSECKRVLQGHSDEVDSVAFSHDSKKVVSGSADETVRIWDAETGKCKRVLEGHSRHVISVVFSHDSKKVASGSLDNTIRIWDAEIGRCEDVISLDRYAGVLSFTPDEHGIVTNRGTFALTGGLQSSAESAMAWQSSKAAILTCIDDTWVTAAGKDLLWLPPECRDGKVAVSGSTVVIGCPSGRVVFLGISMAVDKYVTTEKIIVE